MRMNAAFFVSVLAALLLNAFAFTPHGRAALPFRNMAESYCSDTRGSRAVLSSISAEDYGELAKTAGIVLALGGGLIPAAIGANSAMIGTLTGRRRGGEDSDGGGASPSSSSLDPTLGDTNYRAYIHDSGASGPILPNSALLFANDDIPLVDVIAVMGRIANVNSIADWQNLPSTRLENVSSTNPPMWLPRGAFKVNVRRAKWLGWPTDPTTGEPVGGQELKEAEEGRISKSCASIGDAALDAVWDTWAWGASIATPDKVEGTLKGYRPSEEVLDVNKFVNAAVAGRSVTAFAALTFIVIQLIVYTSLFIAPFLRVFLDIDLGIGELGTCDPEKCVRLFQ